MIARTVLLALAVAAPAAAQKDDKPDPANVQEVVAEGVGKTIDDAIKDACRSAVREVVGLVVDAETRIKNDQVIDDKVLTASGGFVASYERLGKPKEEGGLFRVKIKAKVERSEVVDKLRQLGITVRKVDPGRVLPKDEDRRFSDEKFARLSKEEMQRDKLEIIQDALADLPKVLEASARTPDRFDYDAAAGALKLDVKVSVNAERYVQFLKRLTARLDKLALGKVAGSADAKPADLPWPAKVPGFRTEGCTFAEGPDLRRQPDAWVLWVLTNSVNNGAGSRWAGYVLDIDPRKALAGLAGEMNVAVAVRDADGKAVAEETLDLSKSHWLGAYLPRSKQYVHLDGVFEHQSRMLAPKLSSLEVTQERSVNAMVAPAEMQFKWAHVNSIARGSPQIEYALARTYPVQAKLNKGEVMRTKDIRCAVQFRPEQ